MKRTRTILKIAIVIVLMAMSHTVGRYYANVYAYWLGYESGYHGAMCDVDAARKSVRR